MGFLNIFSRPAPALAPLPSGSFTIDRHGLVLVSTVPSSFPAERVLEIGQRVLGLFREAAEAQLAVTELTIEYTSLKITARELRGGALVFLHPKTPYAPNRLN
jgi:hypothetical protein